MNEGEKICPNCSKANPGFSKFCFECGSPLDAVIGAVNLYLDQNLRARLDAVIKDRFKDREAVEISVAAKAGETLTGWVKLLLGALGIVLGLLSFFGYQQVVNLQKMAQDIQKQASDAQKTVLKQIADNGDQAKQTAADLAANQKQAAAISGRLKTDINQADTFDVQFAQIKNELGGVKNLQMKQQSDIESVQSTQSAQQSELQAFASLIAGAKGSADAKGNVYPLGVDVARFDSADNKAWQILQQNKFSFVFIKATQGTKSVDPKFAARWEIAPGFGLLRGGYHVWTPGSDQDAQAHLFVSTLGKRSASDLPPVIDLTDGLRGATVTPELAAQMLSFTQMVEQKSGCKPILYVQRSSAMPAAFSSYLLWTPQYNVSTPKPQPPWTDWTFWQFNPPSLKELPVQDFDRFNGSLAELKNLSARYCKSQ